MSSKVYCPIVCNSKEGRKGGRERGKQKKRNNLISSYRNRKINFNIFHIMEYYVTVKISIINKNKFQNWSIEERVHCRISIACYYLYEFDIKMFMDACICSRKNMHGNNKCSILDGDYLYGGRNRTILKEGCQRDLSLSVGLFF